MRTGRCPRCRFRMIVVRHASCACGQGHRQILQKYDSCPKPAFELFVRTHICGRRLRPAHIESLEIKS